MKTPEQLKGAIRNIAKKNNLMPQEVLQSVLLWIWIQQFGEYQWKRIMYWQLENTQKIKFLEK